MAKEKENIKKGTPGPMPTGDIHFTRVMSPEEMNDINTTLRDLMTKYGINYMSVYWGRFLPQLASEPMIKTIN